MGREALAASSEARALIETASKCTGVDVARELLRWTAQMRRTEVLQTALVAVALGEVAWLHERGERWDFVAGHSLGELSAWSAAGGVAAHDAVRLASERGRAMADAAANRPGAMAALVGATFDRVREVTDDCGAFGEVVVAAHNAPDEWVLSGDPAAIDHAVRTADARRLDVAGAWHSPSMATAKTEFGRCIARVPVAELHATFVSSVTGDVAAPGAIAALLCDALIEPVRWTDVLSRLSALGAREFLIAGPGRALRSHVFRTLGHDAVVRFAA